MKRVRREERKRTRKVIVPAWGEDFSVEIGPQGNYIVKTSDGVFSTVTAADFYAPSDFLRQYYDAPRRKRETSRDLPHLRFASAGTEEKRLQFVQQFGPVHALVEPRRAGIRNAIQSKEVLREEQRVFAFTKELVVLVNDLADFARNWFGSTRDPFLPGPCVPRKPHATLVKIAECLEQLVEALHAAIRASEMQGLPSDEWKQVVVECSKLPLRSPGDVDNLSKAHRTLCHIFNCFQPELFFAGGDVIESPVVAKTGIRPLLYFMLREVYLLRTRIRRCQREDCGEFFIPDRSDGDYCSARCGNLVHQRELNQRRRKAAPTRRKETKRLS